MNWKYWVIRKMKPNKAKNATVTEPLAAVNRRSRNTVRSSIGDGVRLSQWTKETKSTAVRANPSKLLEAAHP